MQAGPPAEAGASAVRAETPAGAEIENRKSKIENQLLEPDFLARLERLTLVSRRVYAGQMKGERRSSRRGASVEFADYRNYVPGDDLRRVDWNTYARLERLFLKLFVEEEDLTVHLLLDASRSMSFGEPAKLAYAQRVAAALGYIALCGFDRVTATLLGGAGAAGLSDRSDGSDRSDKGRAENHLPGVRGRAQVFRLFQFLGGARAGGSADLGGEFRRYALSAGRAGLAVLVSDFLDPAYEEGLRALAARRFDVTVVHVLDRTEVEPDLVGDLRLVDSESGETREISVSPYLLGQYRKALEEFCDHLSGLCSRYGMDYIRTTTDVPFDELVLRTLRARGVVR